MHGEEDLLKPEWLTHKAYGAGLQSPGPLAGLREAGRQARSSNGGSSRSFLTPDSPVLHHSQQPRSSTASQGVSTAHALGCNEERLKSSSIWSPKRQQHCDAVGSSRGGDGSSCSSSSRGSHTQRSSATGGRGLTHTERVQERSQERSFGSSRSYSLGPSGAAGSSSARGGAAAGSADGHADGFWQRGGTGLQRCLSDNLGGRSGADDKLHWRDSSRSGTAHAGPAARKLDLASPKGFPSLAAASGKRGNRSSSPGSSGTSSSGRHGSPEHYSPSLAPYKQGFLASRASAGWTSKLADVPAAAAPSAAAGAGDGGNSRAEQLLTAQHAVRASQPSSVAASGSAVAAAAGDRGGAGDTAATVAGESVLTPQQQQQQQSLADTLKQAVASSTAPSAHVEAQRRQSKVLVPLLPGAKSKHGSSSSSSMRAAPATGSLRCADAAAVSAAGRVQSLELQSPTGCAPLLKLGHSNGSSSSSEQPDSSSTCAAAAGNGVGLRGPVVLSLTGLGSRDVQAASGAGLALPEPPPATPAAGNAAVISPAAGSAAAGGVSAGQQCKMSGKVGLAGAGEQQQQQQQQLRDRNNFFAVLRRKTSSSSSGSVLDQSIGSSGAGAGSGSGAAAAAEPAAAQQAVEDPAAAGSVLGVSIDTGGAPAGEAAAAAGQDGAGDVSACQEQQQQQQQVADGASADPFAAGADTADCAAATAGGAKEQLDAGSAKRSADQDVQQEPAQPHAHQHKPEQQQLDGKQDSRRCVRSNSSSSRSSSRSGSAGGMMWDVPAEEEAFLRSLGWTSVESDDDEEEWGLTEEEIASFQASAAARAAARHQQQQQQQQQQLDVSGGSYQQKAQAALQQGLGFAAKTLHVSGGAPWRAAGTPGSGAAAVFRRQGGAAISAGATGLLLGVHLAPELLGLDSCEGSSSSSDDEDESSSAGRHGVVY